MGDAVDGPFAGRRTLEFSELEVEIAIFQGLGNLPEAERPRPAIALVVF